MGGKLIKECGLGGLGTAGRVRAGESSWVHVGKVEILQVSSTQHWAIFPFFLSAKADRRCLL